LALWLRKIESEEGKGSFIVWPLDRTVGAYDQTGTDLTDEQVAEWNALADNVTDEFKAKLVRLRKRLEPIKSKRIFQPGSVRP
jgi:hypothetical protein